MAYPPLRCRQARNAKPKASLVRRSKSRRHQALRQRAGSSFPSYPPQGDEREAQAPPLLTQHNRSVRKSDTRRFGRPSRRAKRQKTQSCPGSLERRRRREMAGVARVSATSATASSSPRASKSSAPISAGTTRPRQRPVAGAWSIRAISTRALIR